MKKKRISIFLAAAMLGTLLAGCGDTGSTVQNNAGTVGAPADTAEGETEADEKDTAAADVTT